MKIGSNEKIIFSLLQRYPKLTNNELQALFTIITHKQARIDSVINSLAVKGLIDKETRVVNDTEISNGEDLEDIKIPKKILEGIDQLNDPIKLGKTGKAILYVLSKTKKTSLQFLATFFKLPIRNIYAILKRLEEKNLVISYNSRIRHRNTIGRHYNPKYYVLTDLGHLWSQIKIDGTIDTRKIDNLLEKPQKEIESMTTKFQYR